MGTDGAKAILELAMLAAIAEERQRAQRKIMIGGLLLGASAFWLGYLCHFLVSR